MNTSQQIRNAINVVITLSEAIHAAKEIPSGHLYAMVMGAMTLEVYTSAIETLKRAGLVEEKGHVLRWIGPNLVARDEGVGPV